MDFGYPRVSSSKRRDQCVDSCVLHINPTIVWSLVTTTWLGAASKLPAKALHVGSALQYEAALSQSPSVQLSNYSSRHFGVDRNAKYLGLRSLGEAGLIS